MRKLTQEQAIVVTGYTGYMCVKVAQHDQPCDCAICDEIHRAREARKSRGAKCFLNNDGTSDCDRLRAALQKIARGTLEPGHVYEQAVMMQDIAIKVLQEEHGCTVMGAKVCFACGECDPLTSADLGKNCGGEL